jgi:hypothetical protein
LVYWMVIFCVWMKHGVWRNLQVVGAMGAPSLTNGKVRYKAGEGSTFYLYTWGAWVCSVVTVIQF